MVIFRKIDNPKEQNQLDEKNKTKSILRNEKKEVLNPEIFFKEHFYFYNFIIKILVSEKISLSKPHNISTILYLGSPEKSFLDAFLLEYNKYYKMLEPSKFFSFLI